MNPLGKQGRKKCDAVPKLKFRQELGGGGVTVYRKDWEKNKTKLFRLVLDII